MNAYPAALPAWPTPLQYNPRDPYLRSNSSQGPGKVRRQTTNVLYDVGFQQDMTGDQVDTLMSFFVNNIQFTHDDPKTGASETFKFAAAPQATIKTGGSTTAERIYQVTLKLIKL